MPAALSLMLAAALSGCDFAATASGTAAAPAAVPPSYAETIAILPPALADQIAAGEVVERAASAVKELCENAVDAGARRIDIEIEGGGRRLVRVIDDGGGMSPEEARLALRRHATSKIRSADDLWGLSTFGFRGEALPSIAAVSRLTLSTKLPDAAAGTRLVVEAGVEVEAREIGMPAGTQVEVRDLFFNTPARLKFQKTEATEAANVTEAVLRLALAHPQVHFRLRAGGRGVLDLPAHRDLGERVRAALARRGAGALHEARGEEGGNQVVAYLAAPEEAASTARSTFLFVGGRFVRDRSLLHALALGYGELLEKGRYPLAVLFIDVPGADLDVNVHPQKLEVRFARAAEVYAAVRHVVRAAVARAPWLGAPRGTVRVHSLPPAPRAPFEAVPAPQLRLARTMGAAGSAGSTGAGRLAEPGGQGAFARLGWLEDRSGARSEDRSGARSEDRSEGAGGFIGRGGATVADCGDPDAGASDAAAVGGWAPAAREDAAGAATDGGFFQSLRYVGQLHRTYLVCEADGEMVLVDQHAAHERVAFERLRAAHGRREMKRQRLLFPVPIELDGVASADEILGVDIRALEALGFELEVDRTRPTTTVLLRAVPEVLKDADPKPLLRDVLGQLTESAGVSAGAGGPSERLDNLLATMACHSVVRAGDVLGREQAQALLAQLDAVDLRSHCPHGRPVLLRMSLTELERRFGRT